MSSLALVAVATVNHLRGVRVLFDTFRQFHDANGAKLFTCVVDGSQFRGLEFNLPGTVFTVEDLELPDKQRFLFKYDPFELSCALKPFAIAHVMKHHEAEQVLYLDSDIMVCSPFVDVLEAGWATAPILCTPHFVSWPPYPDLTLYGRYNAGFLAVKASPEATRFLTWWKQVCSELCIVDLSSGLYVDQIWLDLVVSDRHGFSELRNAGLNVGYWNLSERKLARDGARWSVNGAPLRFFHFSGFDEDHLTTRRPGFRPSDAEREIAGEYGAKLREAGRDSLQDVPYGFRTYRNGSEISPSHRRAIFHGHPTFAAIEDPFRLPENRDLWQSMLRQARREGLGRRALGRLKGFVVQTRGWQRIRRTPLGNVLRGLGKSV